LGQILSALAPLATESTLSSLASAVAKETTLAQVLSALGALATESTLDGVKSAVDALASTVDAGAQKVALTDSVTLGQRYEIETIHDAVTLASGEITPNVLIPVNGANILFLAINVSASGWSLVYNHGSPFGGGTANFPDFGYPRYENANVIAPSTQFPILVLPLLTLENFRNLNQPPETWEQALL